MREHALWRSHVHERTILEGAQASSQRAPLLLSGYKEVYRRSRLMDQINF